MKNRNNNNFIIKIAIVYLLLVSIWCGDAAAQSAQPTGASSNLDANKNISNQSNFNLPKPLSIADLSSNPLPLTPLDNSEETSLCLLPEENISPKYDKALLNLEPKPKQSVKETKTDIINTNTSTNKDSIKISNVTQGSKSEEHKQSRTQDSFGSKNYTPLKSAEETKTQLSFAKTKTDVTDLSSKAIILKRKEKPLNHNQEKTSQNSKQIEKNKNATAEEKIQKKVIENSEIKNSKDEKMKASIKVPLTPQSNITTQEKNQQKDQANTNKTLEPNNEKKATPTNEIKIIPTPAQEGKIDYNKNNKNQNANTKIGAKPKEKTKTIKPEPRDKQIRPQVGKNGKLALPEFVLPEEDLEHFNLPNQIAPRKIYDHRNVVLPKSINKKQFGENNQHLPTTVYHREYSTMLFQAVSNDDISTLKALLTRGADINTREQKSGYSPLMQAIKNHRYRTARYLVMRGAKSELKAHDGKTALHLAAINNDFEMMKMLLIAKSNIMTIDNRGRRPCEYISSDFGRNARILVDYYPNPNDALIDFTRIGSISGVQKALQRGANINFREIGANGDAPLIIAAKRNDIKLVSLLLNAGASIDITNNAQITAQQIASQKGYNEIADIIRTIRVKRNLDYIAGGEIVEDSQLPPPTR